MALNRSVFPEGGYDIFKESYDLPLSLKPQALEYQNLKIKPSLTPAEVQRLNELTTLLQDYIVTPEKINHFQDAVSATQKFFVENTVGFVENKQIEMNSYVDLKKTEMQTEIDKFNDRGVYSPSIQYFKNNFVTFNEGTSNQTYLCLQDCVNKEPSSNPLFWRKLTIQGAKGDTGSSGANFVFKGTWNNTATFMKDEAVRFGGMLFVSKIDNNLDNSPNLTSDTDYWFRAMDITITVRKMVGTRNVASQTSTVNFITGEISSFNPAVDSLDVYMNSVRLTRGFDYNINPNNQAIDKINGTWNGSTETPVFFEFAVIKNVINDLVFKDGSALSNGTVTRNKLDVDTQAEINKIAETVIPSINEINTGLSETSSHLAQIATQTELGHIKVGANLSIEEDGTLNAESGGVSQEDFDEHKADYASKFPDNAGAHNSIYRGKYLGDTYTSAQQAAVTAGTFEDMYIGDYWTIGGVNYRIAAFNYYRNTGDANLPPNHITLVPDTQLYTHVMNDANITTGGYTGSKMYLTGLDQAKATINAAFPSKVLTHRQILCNATVDGKASGRAWFDSSVELMNEVMVYGCSIFGDTNLGGSGGGHNIGVGKSQLPLFALNPKLINTRQSIWLRDVVSATFFAIVSTRGYATYDFASNALGVRPAFSIS